MENGIALKIIVFIKPAPDAKIPLECVEGDGRLKEEWNISVLNPDDGRAIAAALEIKTGFPDAHITVVHLGPPSAEIFIREAIALGCDEGLRIWDEGLEGLHTIAKVGIFERVARILGFDLVFTGTRSADTGSAQLGVLLAESLGVPCLTRVARIDEVRDAAVRVTSRLDGGYQEEIECARPLVLAMEADEEPEDCASLPSVVRAAEAVIPCFNLARIGVAREAIRRAEERLAFGPLRSPEPRLHAVQPPDASLPAFERRRRLEAGSMVRRRGKIAAGDGEAAAEQLFRTLLQEGWLAHLRRESKKRE